jgi:PAS domain S-box-containing protein
MKDEDKTKEQLINELLELRRRLAEWEASETERKQAEEALRESEEKYRVLVETSPNAIFVHDRDGRYLYINPVGARFFGKDPDDTIGRKLTDLFPEEQAKKMLEGVSRVFRENVIVRMEYIVSFSGEIHHFSTTLAPIRNDEGDVVSVIGIGYDITERKRAEEALRESEERYRQLTEFSPDVVIVHSGGQIVFINAAGAKIFGAANPQELIGIPVMNFVHPDFRETVRERMRQVLEEGKPTSFSEQKVVSLAGRVMYMEAGAVPLTYQGQPAVQVVARDITGRKRTEAEVKKLRGLLPICSSCKKIRDDQGYWHQVEAYIRDHSEADFTHSICPDCGKKLYGSYWDEE